MTVPAGARRWQFISEVWRLGLPAYRPSCPACGWEGPADECRPSIEQAANLGNSLHADCPGIALSIADAAGGGRDDKACRRPPTPPVGAGSTPTSGGAV